MASSSEVAFAEEVLQLHNRYRELHGSSPLSLDKEMCKYSQAWAEQLAQWNQLKHRQGAGRDEGKQYGENIFMYGASGGAHIEPKDVVECWYNEIQNYNFNSGGWSGNTGHFTQVVWTTSSRLGVGRAKTKDGKAWYVVCNYDPPGNCTRRYDEFVPRPIVQTGKKVVRETAPSRSNEVDDEAEKIRRMKIDDKATANADAHHSAGEVSDFERGMLKRHNHHRRKHGSPLLILDKELSRQSQEWAETLAKENRGMKHRPQEKYGACLYQISGDTCSVFPKDVVDFWYKKMKDFDFQNPEGNAATGGTQVIWKDSQRLGVGKAPTEDGKTWFIVAYYDPPGNVTGRFAENVLPRRTSSS